MVVIKCHLGLGVAGVALSLTLTTTSILLIGAGVASIMGGATMVEVDSVEEEGDRLHLEYPQVRHHRRHYMVV